MVSESQGTIIIYSLVAYTIHLLTKECTLKCTIMYHNSVETKDSIFFIFSFVIGSAIWDLLKRKVAIYIHNIGRGMNNWLLWTSYLSKPTQMSVYSTQKEGYIQLNIPSLEM